MRQLGRLRWLVVGAAVILAIVPFPATAVERWYSGEVYGVLQPLLTGFSNVAPFALLDLAGCVTITAFLVLAMNDIRSATWLSSLRRIVARLVVWSAIAYVLFALAWGLNYRRVRLEARVPFDATAVTADAVARLASTAVDRLNTLHGPAHARGWTTGGTIDPDLAATFERVTRDLGVSHVTVVGRPKRSLLDWYFQRAGVSGMTDPFFLETLVAGDLLPFERPFVVAHEWSHLAGLVNEGEANLAGWLTCVNATESDRYSGWLFMYAEAIGAMRGAGGVAIAAKLADGPRADLRAMRERTLRHVNRRVSAAGWRVYDSYLKANRVEEGTASYDEVIRLALGLRAAQGAAVAQPF
jgi:hypothetical protein